MVFNGISSRRRDGTLDQDRKIICCLVEGSDSWCKIFEPGWNKIWLDFTENVVGNTVCQLQINKKRVEVARIYKWLESLILDVGSCYWRIFFRRKKSLIEIEFLIKKSDNGSTPTQIICRTNFKNFSLLPRRHLTPSCYYGDRRKKR